MHIIRLFPFVPDGSKQTEGGFRCISCSKTIVNFQRAYLDSNRQLLKADMRGIFTMYQLIAKPLVLLGRRPLIHSLVLLLLIGFGLMPIQAQTDKHGGKVVLLKERPTVAQEKDEMNREPNQNPKKAMFRKRKKYYRTTGCPSF